MVKAKESRTKFEFRVFIEKDNINKTLSLNKDKITVKELLIELKILNSTSIVVVNGEVFLDDDVLSCCDSIKILSVISGG